MKIGMEQALRLYGCWRSTCTHRVVLALTCWDLAFEYIPIDLTAREQETPEFRAISPDAQVPVLVVEDTILTQSLAIISYLDSRRGDFGPSLFPSDPKDKARAIGICERVSSFVQPMTLPGGVRRALKDHFETETGSAFDQRAEEFIQSMLNHNLRLLDRSIAPYAGPFALGETFTVADIFVYPQLLGAQRLGCDLTPLPALSALAKQMETRADVRAANPHLLPDAP
jgi:maleylacetoacetate isomerase